MTPEFVYDDDGEIIGEIKENKDGMFRAWRLGRASGANFGESTFNAEIFSSLVEARLWIMKGCPSRLGD